MKRLVLCAAIVFVAGVAQGQLIIDSDMTIDYETDVFFDVHIEGGSDPPTIVNVVEPARFWVDRLMVFETNVLNVFGGKIAIPGVEPHPVVFARMASTVNIFGGSVSFGVDARHVSTVNMFGGSTDELVLSDSSRASVSGGNIWTELRNSDSSVTTIYGTDFNYPYGPIPDSAGTLTGTLNNGDPIDIDFWISDDASIILAIPEPSTFILLTMGVLGFLFIAWKKRNGFTP